MKHKTKLMLSVSVMLCIALSSSAYSICNFFSTGPLGDCPDSGNCGGPIRNTVVSCYTSGAACCKCIRCEQYCNGEWIPQTENHAVQNSQCENNTECVVIIGGGDPD